MMRTVQGDLDPPPGPILGHEHLQIDLSHNKGADNVFDETMVDPIVADLKQTMADYGIRAVVDLSVIGGGRNVKGLRRIAEFTGLPVVCATGFYWEPMPNNVGSSSLEHLRDMMIREIEHGVDATGICCGTIKIGTDKGEPGATVEKLFRAAVAAAQATGASIVTHTSAPQQATWHLDVFEDAGMDLSRVLISHMHHFQDFADFAAIAGRGSFVGIDQVGFAKPPGDPHIADIAAQAIAAGFGPQLIVSADIARRSRLVANGGDGYSTTFAKFLPMLEQRGVAKADIDEIMSRNPREIFALRPPSPSSNSQEQHHE